MDEDSGGMEEGVPFNMALATLKIISQLREEQIGARKNDDVNTWQHSLNSMSNVLRSSAPLTEDEKKTYEKYHVKFTALAKEHSDAKCYTEQNKAGRKVRVQTCRHGTDFHNLCHQYETELIDMGQKYHIFMPSSRDPNVAFRGR